jgi:hypothetical protein
VFADSAKECLLFPDIFPKVMAAYFNERQGSSGSWAVPLNAVDRCVDLIESWCCLSIRGFD